MASSFRQDDPMTVVPSVGLSPVEAFNVAQRRKVLGMVSDLLAGHWAAGPPREETLRDLWYILFRAEAPAGEVNSDMIFRHMASLPIEGCYDAVEWLIRFVEMEFDPGADKTR